MGVAEADAPDASQDVFLVVHRRLKDFDNRAGLRPWLYGICAKVASDLRRRAHVRHEEPVAKLPERGSAPSQDREVERRQTRERLEAVLSSLDAKKREAFVLFELEELSLAEVAQAVGCPLQTAYSRLQAARDAVQTAFVRAERNAS
jgi:RNA polymerase sigma-70 factor (ECF subfamily)